MAKSTNDLEKYKAKRNFAKTPEPKPIVKKNQGNGYLIQKQNHHGPRCRIKIKPSAAASASVIRSVVIYPGTHITKQELADYYLSVSNYIMPHIVDRPLSMVRCLDGAGEPCFFQRHVGLGKSPYLHEVTVGVKGEARDYLMIQDVEGLISLVQWGVIELHPGNARQRI